MAIDSTPYEFHEHPKTAFRFVVIATIVILVFALAVALPARTARHGSTRGVSADCNSPSCISTKQIVTTAEAQQMKRYLGDRSLLVDIRQPAAVPTKLALGSDVHAPFTEPVVASSAGAAKDSQVEYRIGFAFELDEAIRARHMRHDLPVILTSPSAERTVEAALLLQECGYTLVYVAIE